MARAEQLIHLRWEIGRAIPRETRANMHANELELFKNYSEVLGKYMDSVQLDLTAVCWSIHIHVY